jgi:hypothetical protein
MTMHNKGSFSPWFGKMFGSTFVLSPIRKENSESAVVASYEIYKTEVTHLNSNDYKCDEYGDGDILTCIDQYIADELKCVLPWKIPNGTYPVCQEHNQVCFTLSCLSS